MFPTGTSTKNHELSNDNLFIKELKFRVTNYYPVSLNLTGLQCLVIGGGEIAYRKAESLIVSGAHVSVISPKLHPELTTLWQNSQISWADRMYQEGDCQGYYLVICATDQEEINARVAKECKSAGILVNVVDDPQKCSFLVPSVLKRGDLTIAVSTAGASPTTAKRIRKELEQRYGPEYAEYLKLLAGARKEILLNVAESERRREIFERLSDGKVLRLIQQGRMYEAKEWVKKCLS